jgi:hypothetical protein
MELVAHKLQVPTGTQEIVIAPLGDIQWAGHKEHIAYSALQEYIAEALERKAWFIGMGDYVDFASPSNRQRLRNANLYDTAEQVIDDKARSLVDELYAEILAPTAGRWLGLLEGHHWTHLLTGDTTDQYLCSKLRAPFLGTCAYIGLVFKTTNGSRTVTIWVHHGEGGGQAAAAPVQKLEGMANYWEADVMIIGHMTKKANTQVQRCYSVMASRIPTVRYKTIHLVGAGGWLKGYAERTRQGHTPRGGYVEKRMMRPVALGSSFIRISPKLRHDWMGQPRGKGASPERHWEPQIRVET